MPSFRINTPEGPIEVEGQAYVTTIGNREARLFIHGADSLEGARLSCQRTGHLVGRLAPHMLARYVATGDSQFGKETVGAALLINSLVDRLGAAKIWQVMDSAPSLPAVEELAQ